MTPEELEKIGRMLYGAKWQTKLANEIGVTSRTVRNWKSGKSKISYLTVRVIKGLRRNNLIIRQTRGRE